MKKLAVLGIARNEEALISNYVRSALIFAHEVWIGDTGSTDRTKELALAAGAKIVDIPYRHLLEHGFCSVRNLLLNEVSKTLVEWVHWLDIDERVTPEDGKKILQFSGEGPRSIETRTFNKAIEKFDVNSWQTYLGLPVSKAPHIRSHANGLGYNWRGYIHEELYRGDQHAHPITQNGHVAHWHFTNNNKRTDYPKPLLYGFMLNRAMRHRELQKWTNNWWYVTYVHQIPHEQQAAEFRKLCPEAEGL